MELQYRATDARGTIISGVRGANSVEHLKALLKSEGLIPLEVRPEAAAKFKISFETVAPRELLVFTQQLSGLLQAGIRLSRALNILTDLSRGRFKSILNEIRRDIQEGRAFSAALEKHGKLFDRAYVTMVKAGEASGKLPEVLARIAESMEAAQEFSGEILSSLLYPALVTVVGLVSIVILMVGVIPQFEKLFRGMKQELPFITKVVVASSHLATRYGLLVLFLIAVATVALIFYIRSPRGGTKFDRFILRVPLLGEMLLQIEMERFTRMLSLLMGSGVTLLSSLMVLPNLLKNRLLSKTLFEAADAVQSGNGLARFLSDQPTFPPLAVAMIGVGEEGGNLGPMMEQVARIYARETRQSFRRISSLVGPLLIFILAGVTFIIAVAVLMPVFQFNPG
ncbi:MAG TPA: type II secretion system F family protein [Bacillota bacterium]|nr:type II secretion system F family protein [Bacillota bacterium]